MPAGNGKSGLTKRQLKELQGVLSTQKDRLEGALRCSEVSNCDQRNDGCDRGSSEQLVALTVTEQSRKRQELALVMGALERIENGTFGRCQSPDCEGDGSISFVRLKAMPHAIHCFECKTAEEERRRKK